MKLRVKFLGRLRWPWKLAVVNPADRPPLVVLNRYPGQVIGVAFRLPDEPVWGGRMRHKQLSILWAQADEEQYPPKWFAEHPLRQATVGRWEVSE